MRLSTRCSLLAVFGALIIGSTTTIAQNGSEAPASKPKAPGSANQPARTTANPMVEPEPLAALARMGAFLRTLRGFSVHADAKTDEILDTGQKVQLSTVADVQVRRPDRLRADMTSDRKVRQFIYDGKTFTINGPKVGYYATVPAPPTIRELIEQVAQRYSIDLPLADLFYWGTDKLTTDPITSATDLGPSIVGGVETEQYAFREPGLDWQLWIQKGPQPLPRRLVLTSTDEPSQPEHMVDFTWDLSPKQDDRMFAFAPSQNAHRIVLSEAVPQQAGTR